jgi:hypothetical protein
MRENIKQEKRFYRLANNGANVDNKKINNNKNIIGISFPRHLWPSIKIKFLFNKFFIRYHHLLNPFGRSLVETSK